MLEKKWHSSCYSLSLNILSPDILFTPCTNTTKDTNYKIKRNFFLVKVKREIQGFLFFQVRTYYTAWLKMMDTDSLFAQTGDSNDKCSSSLEVECWNEDETRAAQQSPTQV